MVTFVHYAPVGLQFVDLTFPGQKKRFGEWWVQSEIQHILWGTVGITYMMFVLLSAYTCARSKVSYLK